MLVKFTKDNCYTKEILEKGHHYVETALSEVPVYIRKGKCIPIVKAAECVEKLDTEQIEYLGYEGAQYTLYKDDGIHKSYER